MSAVAGLDQASPRTSRLGFRVLLLVLREGREDPGDGTGRVLGDQAGRGGAGNLRMRAVGESRIDATLRTASADGVSGDNQARVSLRHRGFAGTSLADFESRGAFTIPEQGIRAPDSTFELTVTERVHRSRPSIDLRADIAAIALPNLEALEPVLRDVLVQGPDSSSMDQARASAEAEWDRREAFLATNPELGLSPEHLAAVHAG